MPRTTTRGRCRRCLLPRNYRNITFDSAGVCNYCSTYEQLAPRLKDFSRLGGLLEQRIASARSGRDYDCVIGVSGGKDSSWILLQLARRHRLRCLAVTFDNGFLNDYAHHNIELITRKLSIDHIFCEVEIASLKDYYRSYVQALGIPCGGCSQGAFFGLYKVAFEYGIPLVFHGRSRSQMFRELVPGSIDWFLPLLRLNLNPYDLRTNRRIMIQAMARQERFINRSIKDPAVRGDLLGRFILSASELKKAKLLPEYLGYFIYQPYDEGAMMDQLQAQLGWRRPSSSSLLTHSDCEVHEVAADQFLKICGYPMLVFELSVLIREGQLPRAEALRLLASSTQVDAPPAEALGAFHQWIQMDAVQLGHLNRKLRRRRHLFNWFLRAKNLAVRPKLEL